MIASESWYSILFSLRTVRNRPRLIMSVFLFIWVSVLMALVAVKTVVEKLTEAETLVLSDLLLCVTVLLGEDFAEMSV